MSQDVDTSLRIRLLGAFSLSLGDATLLDHVWSRNRASALIKLLALQPSRVLHREQVLDALWPDLDAASAANNLDKNVHYIRTELEKHGVDTPLVVRSGGAVSLDRNALVDVEAFRQAAAAARAARTNPLLYAHAFSLFGGELLPLDRFESWTAAPRDELAALYGRLVIEATQLYEIRSEWRRALDCLERLGRRHTDEEAYRAEMRIHALSGQQDAALLAYERCRDALAEELGAAPSRRTEGLRSDIAHSRIRRRSRLAHVPDEALVGRQTELARLVRALEDAFEGSGGLVLVAGEPGIGKTRLAEELATHAHLRGGHVLWGRCDPSEAAPAFGPWIQAIQAYIEDASGGPKPTLELPLLASPAPGDGSNPAQGRKRLFDSVTTLFKLAADSRSVLLVLDDLHDADAASLQLLRHIAREAPSMNMLVVGTFRDTELDLDDSLSVALGDLVREHLKMRIELGGLNEDEVGQFVELTIGPGADAALLSAIHDETAGNPFFVKECALALGDASKLPRSGARFGVPSNARDAVLHRIDRLTPSCRDALAAASAIGRRFERVMLVKASGMKPGAVLEALDEASRTRVIEPLPDAEDAWMFSHGLTRQAIYERMSARRRADLHGRVAAALEGRGGSDPAELALHFVAAARGGGNHEKAIGYALQAGEAALARFAWEPAINHWETARRMMEEHNTDREQLAELVGRLEGLIADTGGRRAEPATT